LLDAVPDGVVIVDGDGLIRDVNQQLETLFGHPRADLVGQPIELLVPAQSRDIHQAHRTAYGSRSKRRPMGVGMELQGLRKDGTLFPAEISLSPLDAENGPHVIATIRDVTERRRLRTFGVEALRAAEEERLRIAQELHDDTAQQLSTLLLRLRIARNESSTPARDEKLEQLRSEIQRCAKGVRRIARGLRPPALRDVGVIAAIRSHLREVAETAEFEYTIEADPVDERLDDDGKLALYRVVQEAVSNVVRHARANSVSVTIRSEEARVETLVEDNGIGFDPSRNAEPGQGLGLTGMNERARAVAGTVSVNSAPGTGTRIVMVIPESAEVAPDG